MLNDAQQRNLQIVMRLIEEKMRAMEFRLIHVEEHGLMFEIRNDVSPDTVPVLRQHIKEVDNILGELQRRFSLPMEATPTSRELIKGLSQLWVFLQESDSKGLRRFGDVHPGVSPALDVKIERLSVLMLEIENTILDHRRPMFVQTQRKRADSQP